MPDFTDDSLFNTKLNGSTTLVDLSSESNKKNLLFQANFCTNGTADQLSIHLVSVSGTVTNTLQLLGTTAFGTNTQLAPANLLNLTLDAAKDHRLVAVSTASNAIDAVGSGKTIIG